MISIAFCISNSTTVLYWRQFRLTAKALEKSWDVMTHRVVTLKRRQKPPLLVTLLSTTHSAKFESNSTRQWPIARGITSDVDLVSDTVISVDELQEFQLCCASNLTVSCLHPLIVAIYDSLCRSARWSTTSTGTWVPSHSVL